MPAAARAGAAACAMATRSGITRPRRAPARCRPSSMSLRRVFSGIAGRSSTARVRSNCCYEAQGALLVSDVAVVVVEPEVERALTISSLLRFLDRHKIPHMIFINKMDTANARVRDLLGSPAIGLRASARVAPGAAARSGWGNHRLCRPGQRARLPVPAGPALRSDAAARQFLGSGTRNAHRA